MQLTPGSRLGPYEIRHWIGAGGMGEVYYARDTRLGRYVGLKILLPELTANEERLRRFEQEARATSALNHPNILTIFEIGHEKDVHFIARNSLRASRFDCVWPRRSLLSAQPLTLLYRSLLRCLPPTRLALSIVTSNLRTSCCVRMDTSKCSTLASPS